MSDIDHLAFTWSTKDLLATCGVDSHRGLTAAKVDLIRERVGWNQLIAAPSEPLWKRFLSQFADVVVWILLAAAVISGAMGEWTDTAAISAIVLLNAVLGSSTKNVRNERSLRCKAWPLRWQRCCATDRWRQFRRVHWSPETSSSWRRVIASRPMCDLRAAATACGGFESRISRRKQQSAGSFRQSLR